MNKTNEIVPITTEQVEAKMIAIRGQMVLIDKDVAELYGVQTREINQAVKNNTDKFPRGYVIELAEDETTSLKSKSFTIEQENQFAVKNFDRKAVVSSKSRYTPKAFTERGLYMLATILKGKQAVDTTLAIIETYAQMREMARTMEQLQNVARWRSPAADPPTQDR